MKPTVPLDNPCSNVNPFLLVKFSARLVLLSRQQAVAAGRPQSFSIRAHGYSVEPGYSSPATRLVPNTETGRQPLPIRTTSNCRALAAFNFGIASFKPSRFICSYTWPTCRERINRRRKNTRSHGLHHLKSCKLERTYFATLRNHKTSKKHNASRLSYLFAHLHLLASHLSSSDSSPL